MATPPYAAKPKKPKSMEKACQDLAKAPTTLPRTVRLTMPRMIVALYEIRNDRGVGHTGGDVDPNRMDASMVLAGAEWLVLTELVRLHHNVDTATATQVVDSLVERIVPGIWTNGTVRRVLPRGLTRKQEDPAAHLRRDRPHVRCRPGGLGRGAVDQRLPAGCSRAAPLRSNDRARPGPPDRRDPSARRVDGRERASRTPVEPADDCVWVPRPQAGNVLNRHNSPYRKLIRPQVP